MQGVLEHPFLKRTVDETPQLLKKIEQQNAETHQSLASMHGKVDAYGPPIDPF